MSRVGIALERLSRHWVPVLAVLFALLFLPFLDARPFRFEEGRRVAQALAILDGGTWWRLETFGVPYVNKPPLLPWLIAGFSHLTGGANEWAARLPAVISIAIAGFAAGLMAQRGAASRPQIAALAAAVCFLVTQAVLLRVRIAETDGLATAFGAVAFLVWALARMDGRTGLASWLAVAASFAVAAFAKGPIPLLFPLTAMVLIELCERRWRDLAALGAAVFAALMPLVLWAAVNAEDASSAHFASEMRLDPAGSWLVGLRSGPVVLANALLQASPAIIAASIWIAVTRSWRREPSGWLAWALFLYAVPMFVVVALWPGSSGRYTMPSAWPFSVMAGLLAARYWPSRWVVASVAGLVVALVMEQTILLAIEGRTASQRAARAEARELEAAFAELPDGRALLLTPNRHYMYNRFVYAGRNLRRIGQSEAACPPDARFLVAEGEFRAAAEAAKLWSKMRDIGAGEVSLYARSPAAPSGCASR